MIFSGCRAAGISGALESSLQVFSDVDPFNDMDPFEQPIEFMVTSVVSPFSEEYINQKKMVLEDADECKYVLGNDDVNEVRQSQTTHEHPVEYNMR